MAFNPNVDLKYADQQIRGVMVLPHGTGKTKKSSFSQRPEGGRSGEAGAEHVGGEELIPKIQGGWFDFDVVVATPDMMAVVGRLGKVLYQPDAEPERRHGNHGRRQSDSGSQGG